MKRLNLNGLRVGRLLVTESTKPVEYGQHHRTALHWLCRCDCGNKTWVAASSLHRGLTTSCGCVHTEFAQEHARRIHKLGNEARRTHEQSKSRLYKVWQSMRYRCENTNDPAYHNYGGRGIKVCPEWQRFEAFQEFANSNGYTTGLTVERINVNSDYSPQNCKLISLAEQARNRRNTIWVTPSQSLPEFCEEHNLNYHKVWCTIRLKWELESKNPALWNTLLGINRPNGLSEDF